MWMPSRNSIREGNGKTLKALAAGSLSLARTHVLLEKTEQYLENEIAKENRKPPGTWIGKARFYGQKMMHTKHALLCIVILNVLDCLLVLGELIIDIHYLKGVIDQEELGASVFMQQMKAQYPDDLHELSNTNINDLFNSILRGRVIFSGKADHRAPYILSNETKHMISKANNNHIISKRYLNVNADVATNVTSDGTQLIEGFNLEHDYSLEIAIAHKFHYISISILAILVVEGINFLTYVRVYGAVELADGRISNSYVSIHDFQDEEYQSKTQNFLKLICNGKEFFEKKLEVFDAFIVLASFIVDLYFIKGVHDFEIQKFLFILSFLIPWRIIRVVNSLIVAVTDHEHFRLKMLYKQKKEIATELKNSKSDIKSLQNCIQSLREMGISAGIPENVIDEKIAELATLKRKQKHFSSGMFSHHSHHGRVSKEHHDNKDNGLDRQESTASEHAELLRIDDDNNRN